MKSIYLYSLSLFLILSQKDKGFNHLFLTALKMNFDILYLKNQNNATQMTQKTLASSNLQLTTNKIN